MDLERPCLFDTFLKISEEPPVIFDFSLQFLSVQSNTLEHNFPLKVLHRLSCTLLATVMFVLK